MKQKKYLKMLQTNYITNKELDIQTGEKALLGAVLERAIRDALGIGLRSEHLSKSEKRDALFWLFDSPEDGPFSLNWISDHFDLCPIEFRKAIKRFMLDVTKENRRYVINLRLGVH